MERVMSRSPNCDLEIRTDRQGDPAGTRLSRKNHKKADVAEHPEVFHHVGLLFNGSPVPAGLPFI